MNSSLHSHRVTIIFWLIITTFVVSIMWYTFPYQAHTIKIATKLWSDFGAHIPLIRSFSLGNNFPPEYPTFPGEPIRYHYLFYLLVGILERFGVPLAIALNLLSITGFMLLFYAIHKLTLLVSGSQVAAKLAIILFLFNGSLSFYYYFHKSPQLFSAIAQIPLQTEFVSFGPWDGGDIAAFWNLNIYTNQRHLAMGIAVGLLLLLPLIKPLVSSTSTPTKHLPLIFIGWLLLPWLNQAVFVSLILIISCIALLNLKSIPKIITPLVATLLGSLPGLIYVATNQSEHHLSLHIGYLLTDPSLPSILVYWFKNIGFYLVLLPLIFIANDTPNRKIILSVTTLFLLANTLQLSPDIINNHKLINIWMIFIVIYTAKTITQYWKTIQLRPLLVILLVLLTLSGSIDLFPIINDAHITLPDIPEAHTATWINQYTSPNAIFLTTEYLYNPASLAGRKVFLDYGYFNWSLGYQDRQRRQLLPLLFSNQPLSQICPTIDLHRLSYLLINTTQQKLDDISLQHSTIATANPIFSSSDGYSIINLEQLCQNPYE